MSDQPKLLLPLMPPNAHKWVKEEKKRKALEKRVKKAASKIKEDEDYLNYLMRIKKQKNNKGILKEIRNEIAKTKKKRYAKYKRLVDEFTEQQPIHLLKDHEKRGFRNYNLDHRIPVSVGFKLGIPPYIIGHISNLQFIHWKENCFQKGQVAYSVIEQCDKGYVSLL